MEIVVNKEVIYYIILVNSINLKNKFKIMKITYEALQAQQHANQIIAEIICACSDIDPNYRMDGDSASDLAAQPDEWYLSNGLTLEHKFLVGMLRRILDMTEMIENQRYHLDNLLYNTKEVETNSTKNNDYSLDNLLSTIENNSTESGVFQIPNLSASEKLVMMHLYDLKSKGIHESHVVTSSSMLSYTRHGYLKIIKRLINKGYVKKLKRGYYTLVETNVF